MLDLILNTKKEELLGFDMPENTYDGPSFSLEKALCHSKHKVGLIAEIKKASPSKGQFKETLDPVDIACKYELAGADAISVLTDQKYFKGSIENLIKVKRTVGIPVLRKDFIIDQRQIVESKRIGADVILLIAAALEPQRLYEFYQLAEEMGMECLVEVHNHEELENVLSVFQPKIIGINNRNLKTFETTLDTTKQLLKDIPNGSLIVSESGILQPEDIDFLAENQVSGALVGEALMTSSSPEQGIRHLFREEDQ